MINFSLQYKISLMLVSSLALSAGLGSAFAQSVNGTSTADATIEPEITIETGFATFSYGVLYIGVTVENVDPDLDEVTIEYYNPDGALEGSRTDTLSINNGTGMISCYCFGVEREYVEESYSVVVIYGDYSETEVMPPFSSEYPQPPSVLFSAAEQNEFGIYIAGRVSGGIAGEEVNVAIYPQDGGSPLWDRTVESNGKAIFEIIVESSEAQQLLATGTYRVVATHVATGITGETSLEYMNPDQPEQEPAEAEPEPEQPAPEQEPEQPAATQSDEDQAGNEPQGGIMSPFVFNEESDDGDAQAASAGLPDGSSGEETLVMNGTLASYYVLENGTSQETVDQLSRLYILSGNWSMAVNSTAVTDFVANFTIVRADGTVRGEYSLAGFEPVNTSEVQFGPDSVALASAIEMRNGGNATAMDILVTVERFNAVRIDFVAGESMQPVGQPIYGVVDSLVLLHSDREVPR